MQIKGTDSLQRKKRCAETGAGGVHEAVLEINCQVCKKQQMEHANISLCVCVLAQVT